MKKIRQIKVRYAMLQFKQTFMSFFGFCQTSNIQILKQRKNIRQIEGSSVLFCYNVNLLSRVFEKKFAKMKGFR